MGSPLTQIITASEPSVRNQSLDAICRGAALGELLQHCADLDAFRRRRDNLYERVRALFFLYSIHRFHIPLQPELSQRRATLRSQSRLRMALEITLHLGGIAGGLRPEELQILLRILGFP